MTAQRARHRLVLADDYIIGLIAVKLAACGALPVALTPAERQLAAVQDRAQGGTLYLISKRPHVRPDGRGWRTTCHALLALSAARAREHRRIAREELACTI